MADTVEQRDFFISFNSADLEHARAINAALREANFSTFFHPDDIEPGGNIPKWMDDALMNSAQMLALCSPEYMSGGAVYSEAERYARFWQDTRGAEFKLVPVVLRQVEFTPLFAIYKRIDATDKSPDEAAATIVAALKKLDEAEQRETLHKVQPLPKIFNALYRPNPNFTGRFEAMESLQRSLRDANHAAITAVAGLGGVGKTTLAAEYCHRFGSRYGGVWWVRAEQESVMLTDLVTLGQRLKLELTGNVEADARKTLDYLATQTKPWLMVYDNAPNPDAIAKWLPIGGVRCIVTSRFAGFDEIAKVTSLGQWSYEVTADYLLSRTARDDKPGALQLAHTLGGLPLAAEQAAVFLKSRSGIDFVDYAKEVARLIREERPSGARGQYPDTVYAAFVKSLEALNGVQGGKTSLALVRLCSFLSPDGVDLALIMGGWGQKELPADFAEAMANTFARENALAALTSLSLLRQESGAEGRALIFHRLLLEVARDWMDADARSQWGVSAVRLVSQAFPSDADNPANWPICSRLMPHIATLETHAPRAGKAGQALGRLLNHACIFLVMHGDRSGALTLAKQAVEFGRLSKVEPENLATGLSNLAGRYSDLDQLDEAEAAYREALAITEPLLGPNDLNLAYKLSGLATLHWQRKEFSDAEPLYLRAGKIIEVAKGAHSAEYATLLSNLSTLYDDWAEESGQVARRKLAKKYRIRALKVTRSACGARHPHTATGYNNLGVMKAKRADWAGAARDGERAVATMLSLDLASHPHSQRRLRELVLYWQRSGQSAKATRLEHGDISDLLPIIRQIEAEHAAWVAEDPTSRHFGPPSPFATL